jgi:SMODS and SLOG-associating 2TM effector domain 1
VDARDEQALQLYMKYRFTQQESWYATRCEEYEAAQRQAAIWTGVLLVLAAAAAALGTADSFGERRVWAVAAAAAAALSAAVTSYASTYQFDTAAHGYRGTLDALGLLRPDEPGLDGGPDGDVGNYVGRAEEVLTSEVEHWAVTSRGNKAENEDATPPSATNGG